MTSSAEFVRGARITKPKAIEETLTLNEAAYVLCVLAERHGIKDEEEFSKYMRRAWTAYGLSKATV